MMKTLSAAVAAALISIGGAQFQALAQAPQGYPADYGKLVDAAKKEGRLVIYSTTDSVAANPLVKDFEALHWHGLFAPAKTPASVVMRLHVELVKVLAAPEIKERVAAEGASIVGSSPTQLAAFFRSRMRLL